MEDGQRIEHLVVDREVDHRANLRDVGKDGTVRQYHSLRLAFGTRGEQHDSGLFWRSRQLKPAREMDGIANQPQLVSQTNLRADVLEKNQLHTIESRQLVTQLGLFDKGTRGDDGANFSRRAGGLHGIGPG